MPGLLSERSEGVLMEPIIEEVLNILRKMGATDVEFVECNGHDDEIKFTFGGQSVVLRGQHYNDDTGGIVAYVKGEAAEYINKRGVNADLLEALKNVLKYQYLPEDGVTDCTDILQSRIDAYTTIAKIEGKK